MRIAAIPLALLLAAPLVAGAQGSTRPPPSSTPAATPAPPPSPSPSAPPPATADSLEASSRAERPPPPSSRPPPPPGQPPPPPGSPGGVRVPPPPAYAPSPFWAGYGWGYGYYPLYPVYAEPWPGYAEGAPPPVAPTLSTTLRFTGGWGSGESSVYGLFFGVDGRPVGFDMTWDGFVPSQGGVTSGSSASWPDPYGFGSAHLSFSVLQGAAYRIRLLAGGSWLSVPATPTSSAADSFGFDLGTSASVGLVGPLGLEGHARITPYPVQVIDLRLAAAFRAGPFSLLGGYRVIDVAGDVRTGPAARFEGPEFGLGFIF
jgi:hypothetical protein